ncbi:unnamed protein product [[Candida] boidinii]|nr:unnamed protein product [[Candida] boidinii]
MKNFTTSDPTPAPTPAPVHVPASSYLERPPLAPPVSSANTSDSLEDIVLSKPKKTPPPKPMKPKFGNSTDPVLSGTSTPHTSNHIKELQSKLSGMNLNPN